MVYKSGVVVRAVQVTVGHKIFMWKAATRLLIAKLQSKRAAKETITVMAFLSHSLCSFPRI